MRDQSSLQHKYGVKQFTDPKGLKCENGTQLAPLILAYETYGTLNADRSNAVLIHHALSTSSHVRSHAQATQAGWWESMIGPNAPIDTNQYFVICINNLGSCYGSLGPTSMDPKTQQPYGPHFPQITIEDIARSQKPLLEHLGIKTLHAIVSPSMGAMISLAFATVFPNCVERLVLISSAYKSYPANIGIRSLQREIIRLDPAFKKGYYTKSDFPGFVLARKFAHLTYRNPNELNKRFANMDADKNIHSYLQYNSEKFTKKFDANAYLTLTQAMDQFDLSQHETLQSICANVLVISVDSDRLFPPTQQKELYEALIKANVTTTFVKHASTYGHDAFLVETEKMGQYIKRFLQDQDQIDG